MTNHDDEAFDAMMRVALAAEEPAMAGRQPRSRPGSGRQFYRSAARMGWSATPWLMAAGLLVCGSVWWSTRGVTANSGTARSTAATTQDPQPKGPRINKQQLERLANQLIDQKQGKAAAQQLAAAGKPAADLLVERISKLPIQGEGGRQLEGALLGVTAFGRRSTRFVAAIESRLPELNLEQTLAACEALAEAALWTEVPDAIAAAESGSDFLKVFGRVYENPGLAAVNRAMAMFARFRARRTACEQAQAGDLLGALSHEGRGRQPNAANVRLAAIERLANRPELDRDALHGLEQVLASLHPTFIELRWVESGAKIDTRDSNSALHSAAAEVLLRRAAEDPASIRAHARRAVSGKVQGEQRASVLALGRLLADPGAHGGRRIQIACDALRATMTVTKSRMTPAQIALSGDAATAAGMIGPAAKPLMAELLYLAGSPNRGLAERARRAMQRISPQ